MDISNLPATWPIWAIILYLFIKDAMPILSALAEKMTGIIIPARVKERKMMLDQQSLLIEKQLEQEAKRSDLREREVVALEQIGKYLVIIDTRQQALDKKTDLLTTGLVTANQALAIMMDRVHRRREDFLSSATPPPTPLGED